MRLLPSIAFTLGDSRFAVPLNRVVEVSLRVETLPLPGLASPLIGMMVHRGKTIPVLDLRRRLGREARLRRTSDHFLFLRTQQGTVAVEVDRVENVIQVDLATLADPPASADAVWGLSTDDRGFLVVTDPDLVFAHEHRRSFDEALQRLVEPT